MAVVGLDMGNFSSYVGIARAGGVEIVANEYSDRLTPTYVSFEKATRVVGQASKAMEITNAKNTVCNFKRLLGRRYQDAYVQHEKEFNGYSIVESKSGLVNIEVNYFNDRKQFTPEQITGIMFSKLKHITNADSSTKPIDCVIGVPCYFTDAERRAMLDAAQIAGWNCLRLLNETTAVALCYGIYKGDLPEQTEKSRLVAFVDMGHTALQASIVAFNKGRLKMIATAFDPSLGGRDFDRVIMDAMRDDFKKRYKIDAYSSIKAKLRLRIECEKAKKSMSSNTQPIPISLECFIDERDASGKITRADFEELAKPLLDRVRNTLAHLLREAQINPDDLDSVEIVGGSTRIPAVKQIVQNTFRKTPMTTMNADESVARGCTLMCAILSPTFIVKEFKIEDCQPYPITLSWRGAINEDNEVEVFGRWNVIPSTRMLSFYRKEPFTILASYSYPNDIPFAESRIGQYTIEQIRSRPDGAPSKLNVKVRLNRHGIFDITQASIVDPNEQTTQEPVNTKVKEQGTTTEIESKLDAKTSTGEQQEQYDDDDDDDDDSMRKNSAKMNRKDIDLPITSRVWGLTKIELDRLIQQEVQMAASDNQEKERSDAKNAVEEYIYEMRDKLDGGAYEKYSDDKNRQRLLNDLRSAENWLYDDGMHQEKNAYLDRLKSLKNLGDPIRNRYNEAENRQYLLQDFFKSIKQIEDAIQSWHSRSNNRYSHLDKTDIDKVSKILSEKRKWCEQAVNRFNSMRQHENPAILCTQIQQERDALERECWTILNKPKPKVEPPKETPPDTARKQPSSSDFRQQQSPPSTGASSSGRRSTMPKNPNHQSNTQQTSSGINNSDFH